MVLIIALPFAVLVTTVLADNRDLLNGYQKIIIPNHYINTAVGSQEPIDAELESWRGGVELPTSAAEKTDDEHQDAEQLATVKTSKKESRKLRRTHTRSKRSGESVCYGEFGCFGDSDLWGYLAQLPSPPQEIRTHFRLHSSSNRDDKPLAVLASNISAAWGLASQAVDPNRPTKIIVHGFNSHCDIGWVNNMRSALIAVEKCNVICVDWRDGAAMPDYSRAAANARLVGKQIAMFLKGLKKQIRLRFEDVHIIGFSLGAHVAGFAGAELNNIGRITGLDPAGPHFYYDDPRVGLDRTDAKFVDVIHTSAANSDDVIDIEGLNVRLGLARPLGHVDFYPNGGTEQSDCDILSSFLRLEDPSLCNHQRAVKYFIDSISAKCHYPAFACDDYGSFLKGRCFSCNEQRNCGNMGYYADRSPGRGKLYLLTGERKPFCAYQYAFVWASGGTDEKVNFGKLNLALHGDFKHSKTAMTVRDTSMGHALFSRNIVRPTVMPLRVSMTYLTSWHWFEVDAESIHIHKVLIIDGYTTKSSFCDRGMKLTSGVTINMPLYPGDCVMDEDDEPLKDLSSNGFQFQ